MNTPRGDEYRRLLLTEYEEAASSARLLADMDKRKRELYSMTPETLDKSIVSENAHLKDAERYHAAIRIMKGEPHATTIDVRPAAVPSELQGEELDSTQDSRRDWGASCTTVMY
jgi:hypothetical protein